MDDRHHESFVVQQDCCYQVTSRGVTLKSHISGDQMSRQALFIEISLLTSFTRTQQGNYRFSFLKVLLRFETTKDLFRVSGIL